MNSYLLGFFVFWMVISFYYCQIDLEKSKSRFISEMNKLDMDQFKFGLLRLYCEHELKNKSIL